MHTRSLLWIGIIASLVACSTNVDDGPTAPENESVQTAKSYFLGYTGSEIPPTASDISFEEHLDEDYWNSIGFRLPASEVGDFISAISAFTEMTRSRMADGRNRYGRNLRPLGIHKSANVPENRRNWSIDGRQFSVHGEGTVKLSISYGYSIEPGTTDEFLIRQSELTEFDTWIYVGKASGDVVMYHYDYD